MQRVRSWCAACFVWCFLLYNTERMFAPINLASFVYVLCAALTAALIVTPWLQRIPLAWTVLGSLPLVLAGKAWRHYHILGEALPITVTELCAVAVTVVLARQLGRALEEFRVAVIHMMVGYLHDRSVPFKRGQGDIYREIRRARTYERPLSLLAVAPRTEEVRLSLDRFLQEVQAETLHHYLAARIADFLSMEVKDCDIITQRGGHFVLLLPETGREQAAQVVEQLARSSRERLGLELQIGAAVFPEEGSTFVTLLDRAESALREGRCPPAAARPRPAADSPVAPAAGNGQPRPR